MLKNSKKIIQKKGSQQHQLQNFHDLETWRVFLLGASYHLRTCLYTVGPSQMLQQWKSWNSDDYFPTDSRFYDVPSSRQTGRYDFIAPKSELTWVIQCNTNPNTARCFGETYLHIVDPIEEIFPIKNRYQLPISSTEGLTPETRLIGKPSKDFYKTARCNPAYSSAFKQLKHPTILVLIMQASQSLSTSYRVVT